MLLSRDYKYVISLTYMARRIDPDAALPLHLLEPADPSLAISFCDSPQDFQDHWASVVSGFHGPEAALKMDPFKPMVENGVAIHYIAKLDGRSVGTATAIDCAHGICAIFLVTVHPEARNKGIASKMLLQLLLDARKRGMKLAVLEATDMGRQVYLKLGFEDDVKVDLLAKEFH